MGQIHIPDMRCWIDSNCVSSAEAFTSVVSHPDLLAGGEPEHICRIYVEGKSYICYKPSLDKAEGFIKGLFEVLASAFYAGDDIVVYDPDKVATEEIRFGLSPKDWDETTSAIARLIVREVNENGNPE